MGDASGVNATEQPVIQLDQSGTGTAGALNAAVIATTNDCDTVVFSITGTWLGTLTLKGLTNDGNYNTITGYSLATAQSMTTTSTNGVVIVPAGGFQAVELIMTSYTSGTASIAWNASAAQSIINVGQTVAPSDVSVTGNLTSGTSVVTLPNLNGTSSINVDVGGTWVGTITVLSQNPFDSKQLYIQPLLGGVLQQTITVNGNYRLFGFPTSAAVSVQFSSYTSGTANINIRASTAVYGVEPISLNAQNNLVSSWLSDGSGSAITSTLINTKQRLDVNLSAEGIDNTTAPSGTLAVGGIDPTGKLQAFEVLPTGEQFTRDVINLGGQTRVQTITTAAAEALGGTTRLANRKFLSIRPITGTVFWGFTNSSANFAIYTNETFTIAATDNVPIYVIASASVTAYIAEGA